MSAAEAEPIAARSSAKEESEEKAEERRGVLGRDVERLEAAFAVDSTVTSDSAGDNAGDTEELVRLREALRGFRMPAEWEPHDGCWMIWPVSSSRHAPALLALPPRPAFLFPFRFRPPLPVLFLGLHRTALHLTSQHLPPHLTSPLPFPRHAQERPDNWRDAAVPAQQAFAAVAACISRFEPVRMLVSGAQVRARADGGRGEKGGKRPWGKGGQGRGGRNEEGRVGCEREWRNARQQLPASVRVIEMSSNDAWARDICPTVLRAGAMMAELIPTCTRHRTSLVMEGGSLHVDGEGTLITTEQCLLHHSRNPALSRAAIEDHLCALLGISTIIWLPRGLQARDAKSRPLRITLLPLPPALHYSHQDVQGLAQSMYHQHRFLSLAFECIAAGAVVVPTFGIPSSDQRAFEVLQKVFPDREALLSRVAAEPVKVDASKKAAAKGAKPAPAAAKPAAATTAPARSGYNRGGRGGGRGGYGGRGGDYQTFNEPRDNGRAFIAERQVRGEDGEIRSSFDQHHHGDLRRGGGRGGGRGRGYGRDGGQRRPHREFDRMSGTGRGGYVRWWPQGGFEWVGRKWARAGEGGWRVLEIKREGAGRGNWGREGEYLGDETVAPASGEAEPKAEGESAEAAAEVAAPEPPVLSEEELAAQEAARKEKEEEEKQMTLEEYEKVLEEKRKALAASKAAARVVEVDEEMAKMTLKKKPEGDDVFVKLVRALSALSTPAAPSVVFALHAVSAAHSVSCAPD
ncbi:unnamed protein product [Closterium sp. Naga37s-1]|nr:unnamed protein product [Closterium sp. Naga37s-1]